MNYQRRRDSSDPGGGLEPRTAGPAADGELIDDSDLDEDLGDDLDDFDFDFDDDFEEESDDFEEEEDEFVIPPPGGQGFRSR